jgi:prepilin-type N-terminal cleavage/methylation domain-containing protein
MSLRPYRPILSTGPNRRAREGFTLIEVLAVIVILSVLAALLMTQLGGARDTAEEGATKNVLLKVKGVLSEHADEAGDYPRSTPPAELGGMPNDTNVGAECLYLGLCKEGAAGQGVLDSQLANTDEDRLTARPAGFENSQLFELEDAWHNPIAYFHNLDYGQEARYVTLDPATGEPRESLAKARKNEQTGRWHEPRAFQLISAGLDGQFGTEDDLFSFQP